MDTQAVIGFQFPSNGKALSDIELACIRAVDDEMFQFPSNGKALSDEDIETTLKMGQHRVSIPFKRESPFGPVRICGQGESAWIYSFQFPSNGKALSDKKIEDEATLALLAKVSIPFKRESPFGQSSTAAAPTIVRSSFNSLQTGKPFRTLAFWVLLIEYLKSFQFPSNGKALSD